LSFLRLAETSSGPQSEEDDTAFSSSPSVRDCPSSEDDFVSTTSSMKNEEGEKGRRGASIMALNRSSSSDADSGAWGEAEACRIELGDCESTLAMSAVGTLC